MNPHLLLRLPELPEQPVYWLVCSLKKTDDKAIDFMDSGSWPSVPAFIDSFGSTALSSAPSTESVNEKGLADQPLSEMSAIVLIPSARVTLHSLDVQGRITPTIRQSLPWRLEEELSDDVENLHFAVLHHENHQAHLAVASKPNMALWQHWLIQAGASSKRWVPDALMLPVQDNQCCLLDIDGLTLSRFGQWKIAACDSQWQPLLLEGITKEQPELTISRPESPSYRSSPIALLATEACKTQFNLLQGQWQPASPWRQRLLPWWSTALMACLLLIMVTVNSVLDTHQLEQTAATYQQQANSIYQQLFPGERIVRLQSQMRQKLAALQQPEKTSQSMLSMLARITPVLNSFPELKASSMTFSVNDRDGARQSIRIQAQASDFELFTRFREQFEKDLNRGSEQALTIAIEALERTGDKVTGMLVISGGMS